MLNPVFQRNHLGFWCWKTALVQSDVLFSSEEEAKEDYRSWAAVYKNDEDLFANHAHRTIYRSAVVNDRRCPQRLGDFEGVCECLKQ